MKAWNRTERVIWSVGLFLTLSVGFFNHGIIALDDYSEGFARFIPAQAHSFKETAESAGIRLPFQSMVLLSLSKAALGLGFREPVEQLRFVLMLLGAIVFCAHTFTARNVFSGQKDRAIALLFSSCYFILPLIYSRPLIENMSGACLSLAAYAAFKFHQEARNKWVVFSVLALSAASLFRFQSGICVLALPFLIFLKNKKSAGWTFIGACLLSFVGTGLLDLFLTGGFHRSLAAYFEYNLHHASSYGTTPFYTFFLLFLGLSLPPAFFGRYRGFDWKDRYRDLLPILLFFSIFVVAHSLIPHKEERFMVPVLVQFLILLVPLASYWVFELKSRARACYFCGLNFILLVLTSFSAPQNNVIALVRYMGTHSQYSTVLDFEDSVVLVPHAFSLRPFSVSPFKAGTALPTSEGGCDKILAVREDKAAAHPELRSQLTTLTEFRPGPLEALLVRLNPRQNARRGSIYLLSPKGCT